MPRSSNARQRPWWSRSESASRTSRRCSPSCRISSGNCAGRNKLGLARARPGELEAPAVLRLQAQAESFFQLARRRRDAVAWKAHQEARGDHYALAKHADPALGDVAPVQVDLAVEIRSDIELPVGGDCRGEAPR